MCIFHGKNGYITLHLFMFVLSQDAIFLALFPKNGIRYIAASFEKIGPHIIP